VARADVVDQRGGAVWLATEGVRTFDVSTVAAAIADPDQHLLVGTLDDIAVGYLRAEVAPMAGAPAGRAVIRELYVEHEAREVGVGEDLMESLLDWARARGCTGIDAFAHPGSREIKNLFERYGLIARAILVHRPLGAAP